MMKNQIKTLLLLLAKVLALLGVLFVIYWVNTYAAEHDIVHAWVAQYGYAGVFVAAVISGFNLLVPVPVIGFYPFFLEVGLHPIWTVVLVSVGLTLGDMIGFFIGNQSRDFFSGKGEKMLKRIEHLEEKHRMLPLVMLFFYIAFVPLPNELLVIPMAFFGFKFRHMAVAMLLGNILFNTLAAVGVYHIFS